MAPAIFPARRLALKTGMPHPGRGRAPDSGIKHFEWLLGCKNAFSYDDRRVEMADLLAAKVKMEQFFAWAFQTFPSVAQINEAKDA